MGTSIETATAENKDAIGQTIACYYAKNPPDYLVYRNEARVMVHFADDARKAKRQRAALAALNPLRGQISGLIDGWHSSTNEHENSRAARYDRRVADAVIMGLEGSVPDALALLAEIRDAIIAERKSIGRTDYLLWAAGTGLLMILLISALSAAWFAFVRAFPASVGPVWTGAAGGTIGAFFSIATGLRSRTVLVDLQQWDNRRDAILRIAVGTIGGAILVSLFLTGLVSVVQIDEGTLRGVNAGGTDPVLAALVMGFIAGFAERAVPDLLAKANVATDPKDDAPTDVAAQQARTAALPVPHSLDVDGEDDEDGDGGDHCLADAPPLTGETLTEDKDLPPAQGGVAEPSPEPAAEAESAEGEGAEGEEGDAAGDAEDPEAEKK